MSPEKQKEKMQSVREIESHHFNQKDSLSIDDDFVIENALSLDKVKKLIFHKQAELAMDKDLQGLDRARVFVRNTKDGKTEEQLIFSTVFPFEIDELADIAYNTEH